MKVSVVIEKRKRGSFSIVKLFPSENEAREFIILQERDTDYFTVETHKMPLPLNHEIALGNACRYQYLRDTAKHKKGSFCGASPKENSEERFCAKHQAQSERKTGAPRKKTMFNYFVQDVAAQIKAEHSEDSGFKYSHTFKIAGERWRSAEGEEWRRSKYLQSETGSQDELLQRWESGDNVNWKGGRWVDLMNAGNFVVETPESPPKKKKHRKKEKGEKKEKKHREGKRKKRSVAVA